MTILRVFYMKIERRVDSANKIATTIVKTKKNFSAPLFLWYVALPSPPPKAPPSSVPDCCIRTPIINSTESIICTYGNTLDSSMSGSIAQPEIKINRCAKLCKNEQLCTL